MMSIFSSMSHSLSLFCLLLFLTKSFAEELEGSPPLNTCQPACLNNGVCRVNSSLQTTFCECPEPDSMSNRYYRGASCQTEAIKCSETWWCENGGLCNDISTEVGEPALYNCSCPTAFEGSKCQNPVETCGDGLWCANGGTCEPNIYSNGTICKCPSTHTGINCQTLIEPQELGGDAPTVRGLDSQNTVDEAETVSTADDTEEDRDKYFRLFYWIMGALILTWITALIFVHWSEFSVFKRSQRGHIKMEALSLKKVSPFRDSADVEDPTVPDTPGSSDNLHSKELPEVSKNRSFSQNSDKDMEEVVKYVPTFSDSDSSEAKFKKPGE